jgi:hypothetical protein
MSEQTLLKRLESTNFRTTDENGDIVCSLVKLSNEGNDYVSKYWVDPQRPEALFQGTDIRHANSLEKGEKFLCVKCPYSREFDKFSKLNENERTKAVCETLCQGYNEIKQGLMTVEMERIGKNSYRMKV